MKKFLILLSPILLFFSCIKDPSTPGYRYELNDSSISNLNMGESDSNLVYQAHIDSNAQIKNHWYIYPASSCAISDFIDIRFQDEDTHDPTDYVVYISSNVQSISFSTIKVVDTTYLLEYEDSWPQKRDSVHLYTSYYQNDAVPYEIKTNTYAKSYSQGENMSINANYNVGPVKLFRIKSGQILTSLGSTNFVFVHDIQRYDIQFGEIVPQQEFYIGFKYISRPKPQLGYLHMRIDLYDGYYPRLSLIDWAISR